MVEIEIQSHTMTQVEEANQKLLRPAPKVLEKALKDSANLARRIAEAFGLKVPGIAPKPAKTGSAATTKRGAQSEHLPRRFK